MVLGEPPAEPGDHPDAKHEIVVAGARLRRIYWPDPYHVTATSYRAFGPRARFDHHRRPGPFPQAAEDSSRGVFYAAPSLQCCLLECFGDEFVIDPTDARLTVLAVKRDLRVLDLRGQAAVNAGTVAAVNQDGDRRTTQDWGRYWYEHPDMAGIEGLLFAGAHDGDDALVVNERCGDAFEPLLDLPMLDPHVLAEVLVVADELGMVVLTTSA